MRLNCYVRKWIQLLSQNFRVQKKKSVHELIYLQIQIKDLQLGSNEEFYILKMFFLTPTKYNVKVIFVTC